MKIQFQTHLVFARKNPGWPLVVLDGLWGVSDALIIISLYFFLELNRHLNWSDFSVCPAPSAGCATGPSRAACTWISFSCSQIVEKIKLYCLSALPPTLSLPPSSETTTLEIVFFYLCLLFILHQSHKLSLFLKDSQKTSISFFVPKDLSF